MILYPLEMGQFPSQRPKVIAVSSSAIIMVVILTRRTNENISHGILKHPKNPLLYPSKAEIEHYGLEAQGKEWEK